MKKTAILLLCLVLAVLLPLNALAKTPTEAEAYSRMIALKEDYPEGTPWTNDNFYAWNGGIYSGGYGCVAFAFLLSDAAFGTLPARMYTEIDYDSLRVGDILRVNSDTHSVIILEKHSDHVVLAEGNYNRSVHWGRMLAKSEVLNANYYLTRYPLPEEITQSGAVITADPGTQTAAVSSAADPGATTVTIPATVTTSDGTVCKVTEIAANAFKGMKKLQKVTIGKNVVTIGDGAFQKCTALTAITLDKKVAKIGKNAFNGCKKLKTITIKTEKLKKDTIGKNCFKGIYAKATFKCPKKMLKNYKAWFLKPGGAPKTAKFK